MTIKQIINVLYCVDLSHKYYVENNSEYSSLFICEDKGKYGITNKAGETVLPFEYDNINILTSGILLLVKKGKQGILHIKRDVNEKEKEFELARIIPCEYDRITAESNGAFVIMEKDSMFSKEVWLYFKYTEKITGPFCRYMQFSNEILEVFTEETRYLYDISIGEAFFTSDTERFAFSTFRVGGREGNFDKTNAIIYDAYDIENGLSCLIYYNGEETFEYVFEGIPYLVYDLDCCLWEGSLLKQIAVRKDGNLVILDDKCNPIATFTDDEVALKTQLLCRGITNEGELKINCQKKMIRLEET